MEQELQSLRQVADRLVSAKRAASVNATQLQQITNDGMLHILGIKEASKRLCTRVEGAKEHTHTAKLSLEVADTTLQNLLYEKSYYEKEIRTCRSFTSKVPDSSVALMPEDKFLASLGSSQEDQELRRMTDANPHERMKARLIHESRLRKSLVKQLDQLKQLKQSMADSLSKQQHVLEDLKGQLKNVEGAAKPLQLVLTPTVSLNANRVSELLPTPLYIVYSQLMAAREALQVGCTVNITGSVDEAENYARSAVSGESTLDGKQGSDSEDVYQAHPLSVELHIHSDETLSHTATRPPIIIMTVILQYLPALKVVTAHCQNAGDNPLLKALFPEDDGSANTMESLQHLKKGSFKYSSTRAARPFRWCQHLAGLDFVPTFPALALQILGSDQEASFLSGLEKYRRQQRAVSVVSRLRAVKAGDMQLNKLMTPIIKNQVPSLAAYNHKAPTSLVVTWELIHTANNNNNKTSEHTDGTAANTAVTAKPSPSPAQKPQPSPEPKQVIEEEEEGALDDGELPQSSPPRIENMNVDEDHAMDVDGNEQPVSGATATETGSEMPSALEGFEDDDVRGRGRRPSSRAAIQSLLNAIDDDESLAAPAPVKQVKAVPANKVYRLVARNQTFELEAHVRVFLAYPTLPPLFRVVAIRKLQQATGSSQASKSHLDRLKALAVEEELGPNWANSVFWIEQQVNVHARNAIQPGKLYELLLHQVVHLRQCLDSVARQHELSVNVAQAAKKPSAADDASDLAVLYARQQLTGRERQPPGPAKLPIT